MEAVEWLVDAIQEVSDTPLCLDTTKPEVMEAGLKKCKQKAMINSTTGQHEKLDAFLPLAVKYNASIIGLAMDEKGIPRDSAARAEIALRIVAAAMEKGISLDDLYIDPLILPANVAQPTAGHVLETLRLEKAYREYGLDIDNTDTPLEVGLGFAVDLNKPGGFIGIEALLRQRESGVLKHRLVQFLLEDPEPLLYGSEPIYRDGELVGSLRSGGYGHTLGGAVGLGSVCNEAGVTPDYVKRGSYEIEVAGVRYPARASLRPLYDPKGKRIRA